MGALGVALAVGDLGVSMTEDLLPVSAAQPRATAAPAPRHTARCVHGPRLSCSQAPGGSLARC